MRMMILIFVAVVLSLNMGCGGVQTEPTCQVEQEGILNFYNHTDTVKLGVYCRLDKSIETCSNIFGIPPGFSFVTIKYGLYQIYMKMNTTQKQYEIYLRVCDEVDFVFREVDEVENDTGSVGLDWTTYYSTLVSYCSIFTFISFFGG